MKRHHLDVNAQGPLLLKWPVLTTTWQAKLLKDEWPWEVLSVIIDKNSWLSSTVCPQSQPDKSKALALCCFTVLSNGNWGLTASTGSKAHLLYWSSVFSLLLASYDISYTCKAPKTGIYSASFVVGRIQTVRKINFAWKAVKVEFSSS